MLLAQILLLITSLTVILTPVAAARGMLPRNRIIGFRVPALLASDAAWRAGHHAAIRSSMIGGFALLVATLASFFVSSSDTQRVIILAACIMVTAATLWGTRQAVVAAKRVTVDAE